MSITEFIHRCDAYAEQAGVSRSWLSKRLFNDTFRLRDLADGVSDIGVMRLARAAKDLAELERTTDDDAPVQQVAAG